MCVKQLLPRNVTVFIGEVFLTDTCHRLWGVGERALKQLQSEIFPPSFWKRYFVYMRL